MTGQMYFKIVLWVAVATIFSGALQAQRRFEASVLGGLTASQIDGDVSAGYHKVGLQGGLNVMAKLKGRQSMSVEMLFTQRGARNQPQIFPVFAVTLNYVEAAAQWHYADWLVEESKKSDDWYRARLNVGVVYGRLIGYRDRFPGSTGLTGVLPVVNENSFCFALGGSIFASRHWGLTFRYQRALNFLYNASQNGIYDRNLREHYLTFQLNYRL
jgi:hypothetical protein